MTRPSLPARLGRDIRALAAGRAPDSLVSLSVEWPDDRDDWLDWGLEGEWRCWAEPSRGEFRLGLGRALRIVAAGPGRFAALKEAHARLGASWQREGEGAGAFLAFPFDETRSSACAEIAVPAVLLVTRGGRRQAVFSCLAGEAGRAEDTWRASLMPAQDGGAGVSWQRRPTHFADRMWLARVGMALRDIAEGQLEKVVLSRSARLVARETFLPARLLAALSRAREGGMLFGMGQGAHAFLGRTPERLVSLEAGLVRADALAGTSWQGDGAGLLADGKNRHEHGVVVQAVHAALAPLCRTLFQPAEPGLVEVGNVRHLRTPLEGRVGTGVDLFDLVAALHPTPAVGGMPGAAAREWLLRHGEIREDWYTGGVGWLSPEGEGEVRVALRCASVSGREARLYAGAGIVAGSSAQREFEETEAKFGTMLDAFEACRSKEAATRAGGWGALALTAGE